MDAFEQVTRDMRDFAIEVKRLGYSMPAGLLSVSCNDDHEGSDRQWRLPRSEDPGGFVGTVIVQMIVAPLIGESRRDVVGLHSDGGADVVILGDGGQSRYVVPNTNWPLAYVGVVGKADVP